MNIYSIKPVSLLCAAALSLASCSKTIEEGSAPGDGGCRVKVTVGMKTDAPAIFTRSISEAQESNIDDLNLFAYHPETGITRHLFLQSAVSASLRLFAGKWEFYAVANANGDMKDSTVQSLLASTQSVETEEALTRGGTLLMTGYNTMEIGEGAASVHIELERLAVKLRIAVAVAPAMRERISVHSMQARSIPATAKYFGDNNPIRFFDGEAHEVSENAFAHTYYLPENFPGTVSSVARPQDRTPVSAPKGATCFVIEALCDGLPVSYYVYPGENDTSDFNIRRNSLYLLNVTLCGGSPADMRVDAFDMVPDTPVGDVYERQEIPVVLECTANNYAGQTFDIAYRSITGNSHITVNGVSAPSGTLAEGLSGTAIREVFEMTVSSEETGPVAVEFSMTDNEGHTLTRTLSWDIQPARHIVFSPVYTYGMGTRAVSSTENDLLATVSFLFTTSVPLPAPVTVSFDYYWQSRYTSGSDIAENYHSYTLETTAGMRGSGVTLFNAETAGEPIPRYHNNGFYTRPGYMIVEGGTLIIRSVSDPPPGYVYDINPPRIIYQNLTL